MDDQLDNDLRDHIKEVFHNFEDPSANEGWLLLREKFPEQQSKRRGLAWIWWGSSAAILLAFLGIGLWMINRPVAPKNNVVKMLKYPERENLTVKKIQEDTTGEHTAPVKKHPGKTQATVSYQALLLSPVTLPGAPMQSGESRVKTNRAPAYDDSISKSLRLAKATADSSNIFINKNKMAPQMAVNNEPNGEKQQPVPMQEKKPIKSIIAMFNEDKGEKAKKTEDASQNQKVRFAVYAATYFNYAKGSDNQVNAGAGFTSDIRISTNLKLVTGISIAQNSLSYTDFPSAVASAKSNLYVPSAVTNASMAFTASSTPKIRNYNASLIGLDIPINIKYEFNPQKSDAYFSMGLSSGTFIDESYTYKYNYPSFLSEKLQQTQDETTGKNFGSFYFAKTLNVAFGIGYPFGKNRLIIEPFLKYPLDGMGSQNLKFGAGGLNLKLNFQSPHK
ncbi:hypothetical protein [Mucilaginibacter xinganensis]|uniref:Outer membrane protein beta-barrel domain-containing protein n=1 Tax=Mucilaginibacter xinganensis TaxID=1234841 RepID=A0A223P0B3_9SPHI|nr:hypothetical protein [Mucilaginibacter xinganensis]ASU35547.1 hypothetical protein MuYL_3662 [Mucilaginibacter xinganensis]